MVEGPVTKIKVCENLNPATFLPEKENETLDRDCSQFITLSYAAQEDLMDTPLDNPELHSLKLETRNNHDQMFHFPSQEGKWQDLNFHIL